MVRSGHIGFGIRPSRRRGRAAWALGQILLEAKVLAMDRVLVMWEAGNVASAKTIESQGGDLADLGELGDDSALALLEPAQSAPRGGLPAMPAAIPGASGRGVW